MSAWVPEAGRVNGSALPLIENVAFVAPVDVHVTLSGTVAAVTGSPQSAGVGVIVKLVIARVDVVPPLRVTRTVTVGSGVGVADGDAVPGFVGFGFATTTVRAGPTSKASSTATAAIASTAVIAISAMRIGLGG